MRIVTKSTKETRALASKMAREILSAKNISHATVIALKGNLGAGKTTFVQGFIKVLLPKARVKSPTFLLIKHYPRRGKDVYHIDCYRVKGPSDLKSLEIKEVLANPKNIVLIEWPERIQKILPKNKIIVSMRHKNENERLINVSGL
ncbi:MAG: tRNA (adenosine(37)-N6)-threonylcarbamoyltransferase complex ATPase subunit type 1 TsaE [Patescibacteria group bacterium]